MDMMPMMMTAKETRTLMMQCMTASLQDQIQAEGSQAQRQT